ncbi:VOC family protein [Microbispora hainanensis]|uniref:VOC family protein n=1 Tax=Microbispora hainanensis TaxID=568844 RepID=A0ABZ1T154_9ACTN|nr:MULTISPECIES: VOC family protein [Microbispora]NJP23572.1 VOC family protein [Microbispora sp. CL1-1]TQS15800.1 VOC family protein [Microbispora sp. SCL1-1]
MTTPAVPAVNTVAWFEVASDDPEGVQRFYGDLFGWRFQTDENSAAMGMDYRLISYDGDDEVSGGVFGIRGDMPGHAIFTVLVRDVAETCRTVETLGGKVLSQVVGNESGPDFAYLHDPSGNLFGIFAPAGS